MNKPLDQQLVCIISKTIQVKALFQTAYRNFYSLTFCESILHRLSSEGQLGCLLKKASVLETMIRSGRPGTAIWKQGVVRFTSLGVDLVE